MFSKMWTTNYTGEASAQIALLREKLASASAVLIGAGAGLSTAAGLTYSGERFQKYFADFIAKYHIPDMYAGGFYPFESLEEHWAWWSRHILVNRYMDAPLPVYPQLLALVQNKDYFVLTTNVDHQFQRAGFDKQRMFYTQGDYGLFQCSEPCCQETYDNEEAVRQMVAQQVNMRVPGALVPRCPVCGKPMTMNLRADDTFVEDAGWHAAAARYAQFVQRHKGGNILLLELGVGHNTPGIIKYPFWRMARENTAATYACVNMGEAYTPKEIAAQSICINGDIAGVLGQL